MKLIKIFILIISMMYVSSCTNENPLSANEKSENFTDDNGQSLIQTDKTRADIQISEIPWGPTNNPNTAKTGFFREHLDLSVSFIGEDLSSSYYDDPEVWEGIVANPNSFQNWLEAEYEDAYDEMEDEYGHLFENYQAEMQNNEVIFAYSIVIGAGLVEGPINANSFYMNLSEITRNKIYAVLSWSDETSIVNPKGGNSPSFSELKSYLTTFNNNVEALFINGQIPIEERNLLYSFSHQRWEGDVYLANPLVIDKITKLIYPEDFTQKVEWGYAWKRFKRGFRRGLGHFSPSAGLLSTATISGIAVVNPPAAGVIGATYVGYQVGYCIGFGLYDMFHP